MPLFNVTWSEDETEHVKTYNVDTPEEALRQAKQFYGKLGVAFDAKVAPAPAPPPTVLDKDNVTHPDYLNFAGADPSRVPQASAADDTPEA
jgi:hypothetical protein